MLCGDNVVISLDGEMHVPINFKEANNPSRKIQSNVFLDLGKKLLQSARDGDINAVNDLMSKGAPFSTDWLGFSPLHLAVVNNHVELCDVLIRAGIGKDGRTKVDRTPLHFAAYHGHVDILKILLYSGADVDCKDMLKMTPLHWAVENGHEECACLLLNFGAYPRAESKFYRTPLSIAMDMGWTEMVGLLQMSTNVEATKSIIDSVQDADMNENEYSESINKIDDKDNDHSDTIEIENDTMTNNEETLPQMDVTNPATVQLLKDHGIAMIPNDNTNTVTSAFQSGRQIVLSDAGKLVLRECKVQNEATKPMNITKRPLILPRTKLKETKVYTVSSSQFLAMTKPNSTIPMNIIKNTTNIGNNLNIIQLPQNKVLNTITSTTPPLLLVKKLPGNVAPKSDVLPIKPKIVNLKPGPNLNNVKIVLNNQNVAKIINSNANVPVSSQNGIEAKNDNILNTTCQQNDKLTKELVSTKSQLACAKLQIENYKRKIQELEAELRFFKNKYSRNSLIDLENNTITLS